MKSMQIHGERSPRSRGLSKAKGSVADPDLVLFDSWIRDPDPTAQEQFFEVKNT
jgi:hypothetical protein